MRCQRIFRRDF